MRAALGITHDDVLKELFNIPVIVDLDIGHVNQCSPLLTVIKLLLSITKTSLLSNFKIKQYSIKKTHLAFLLFSL